MFADLIELCLMIETNLKLEYLIIFNNTIDYPITFEWQKIIRKKNIYIYINFFSFIY